MNNQQINQKVAKVREVVSGVSTNDIILALHSFDLNVERTIQAFCEDGASAVLDDWVRPTSGSTKSKNKKKKVASETPIPVAAPVLTAPIAPPKTSSAVLAPVSASAAPSVVNGSGPAKPNGKAKQEIKPTSATKSSVSPTKEQIQQTFKALRFAISEREKSLLDSNLPVFDVDISHILTLINSIGMVVSDPKPVTVKTSPPAKSVSPVQAIKHATSQSSITSSVGADSGVNLSPVHKEEKNTPKPAAQVAGGGFQMSSDGLSTDQLAALQRSLEASLAARGIDASVLSNLTSGDMPARRPRKNNDTRSKPPSSKDKKAARPQLSIFDA